MPLDTADKPAEERTMTRTITTIAFVVAPALFAVSIEIKVVVH